MRTVLLIFFISLLTVTRSQTATADIYYGYQLYSDDYYGQLNSINKVDLNKPFSIVAIGFTEHLTKRKYQKIKFSFLIPSNITLQDTLNFKTTGFSFDHDFSVDLIKNSSYKSKKKLFYLLAGLGYSTGQIYLTGNNQYQQKNPFFAPKLTLQPRIRIGKMILSLTFDYRYDVSKGTWKNTKFNPKKIATVNDFKQSGLTGLFSIGYCFN